MADLLATPSDLNAWLQKTVPTDTALVALETATGWIQADLGQRVLAQANDTVTLRGGYPSLWLPQRPVTAVSTVTTTDKKGVVTPRTLNTHYYVIRDELRYAGGYWPELVTVTYSHGYTQIPQAIRGVCLSAAVRTFSNPGGFQGESVGSVSWQAAVGVAGASGLNRAEREALDPFRQLVVA
jgi:hypothetical protein